MCSQQCKDAQPKHGRVHVLPNQKNPNILQILERKWFSRHNSMWEHKTFIAMETIAGKFLIDQTGRSPIQSSQGCKYVIIFYLYDANIILSVLIKNNSKEEILHAYKNIYTKFNACWCKPCLNNLNNETSTAINDFITMQQAFIKPMQQRKLWNLGKILASLSQDFSIRLWCCLTEQAYITLNKLWECSMKPYWHTKHSMVHSTLKQH